MKRTSKILAVVLSLALICTAVIVSAFAANDDTIKGIDVKRSQNYDGFTPDWGGGASAGNPVGDVYAWTVEGRTGTISIGTGGDGNQYMIYTQTDKVGANGPYFGTGYAGSGTTARPTLKDGVFNPAGDIKDYPFLVFDFDFMSPTGKFMSSYIGLEMRSFFSGDETLDSVYYTSTQSIFGFASDEGGCYVFINGNRDNTKTYINPFEFTHATIVFESVATDTYRTVNTHVYLNGELWQTVIGEPPALSYYNNIPHVNYDEIRFNFTTTNDATQTLALDNVVTRLMTSEYNGTLKSVIDSKADLSTWESSLYDENNRPLGLTVASVGDREFDNLQKAVDYASAGDTVKVVKDCASPVIIDKLITIDAGDCKVDLKGADNFGVKNLGGGVYNVVSTVGQQVSVYWDDCYCDEPCDDEAMKKNHPLYHYEAKVDLYAKLYDIYNPTYMDFKNGDGVLYELVGWKHADGGAIDENTIVTFDDVSERYIELVPVYKEMIPVYQYIKGGKVTYADKTKTLAEVFESADANTTITLLNDAEINSSVTVTKSMTVDINGKTLKAVTNDATGTKFGAFKINGGNFTFTLTSSVAGGTIFCQGANKAGATDNGSAGVINLNGNGANLKIKGNDDEGNVTLTCYSAVIIESYSAALNSVEVDGGMYIGTRSDNMGFFDFRNANKSTVIKNAFIYNPHQHGLVTFSGRNHTYIADNPSCVIDNCVLIGNMTAIVAPVTMTITNSYIKGDLLPAIRADYPTSSDKTVTNTVGNLVLGSGNYINGKLNDLVKYADGLSTVGVSKTLDVTYYKNNWTFVAGACDPSSYVLNEVKETLSFSTFTTDKKPITVTWKDAEGNILGTSMGIPGFEIAAPDTLKSTPFIEGWLAQIPDEWTTSTTIPEDATEYEMIAKEGGKVKYIADVDLLFNIRLTSHIEYRMYIPEVVEGIEVTAVDLRGDRLARYKDYLADKLSTPGKYVINGKNYVTVDGWPGMKNAAAEDSTFGITFTYGGETYTVKSIMNIPKYCDYVLNSGLYTGEALNLAANVANYVYEGCKYLNDTTSAAKLEELVKNNTAKLYTPTAEELDNYPTAEEMAEFNKYVSSVELVIVAYGPKFRFHLTAAGKNATIKLSTSAMSGTGNQSEYSQLGYIETNNTHLANLNKTTVTITPAGGGEKVEFTYTLANYCKALESKAEIKPFLYAMYGYAKAATVYQEALSNKNA